MKKLLFLVILLLMPLLAAASVEVDSISYDLNAATQEASVTSRSDGYSGNIVIPPAITVDEIVYNVTSIGEWAFNSCSDLISVTIPESVTSIGNNAFAGCSSLTSVAIPKKRDHHRNARF